MSSLRSASVREQLAASGTAAITVTPNPGPGAPKSLFGRLGIRKPSILSLTSPHASGYVPATARTFSLDDLLKPPLRRKAQGLQYNPLQHHFCSLLTIKHSLFYFSVFVAFLLYPVLTLSCVWLVGCTFFLKFCRTGSYCTHTRHLEYLIFYCLKLYTIVSSCVTALQ